MALIPSRNTQTGRQARERKREMLLLIFYVSDEEPSSGFMCIYVCQKQGSTQNVNHREFFFNYHQFQRTCLQSTEIWQLSKGNF